MSTESERVRPGRSIRRVLQFLAVTYVLWLVALFFLQRSILFPRSLANGRYAPPPAAVEVWREERPDGIDAIAWFVSAPIEANQATGPRATVVLVHGNAMLAGDWLDWAESIAARGVHVLLPEFRGYGRAEGVPTRDALVADLQALLVRLRSDPRVNRSSIVVYGRSIGGAIAADALATDNALGGEPTAHLILHTAPARIRDLSWRFGAPPFLVRDPFDALAALASLRGQAAITVIGHDRDEVVPTNDAARLATAAGVEPIILRGTHNVFADRDAERQFEDLFERIVEDAAAFSR